jgi:hypothetical protein
MLLTDNQHVFFFSDVLVIEHLSAGSRGYIQDLAGCFSFISLGFYLPGRNQSWEPKRREHMLGSVCCLWSLVIHRGTANIPFLFCGWLLVNVS